LFVRPAKRGKIVQGKTAWGCSNFKGCCQVASRSNWKVKDYRKHDGQLVQKGQTRPFKIQADGKEKISRNSSLMIGLLLK
jgi:hypothetical protein